MTRKKRLGRGLESLLNSTIEPTIQPGVEPVAVVDEPVRSSVSPQPLASASDQAHSADTIHLNVYEIENNPFQPRRLFSESEIVSLSESLKEHDLMQPVVVRIVDGRYQLISGERRLRAAIKANWQTIPARIRDADDRLVSELAIVENLQRKDLNPVEKALSFRRYIDEHRCTQEDLAGRLKIDRSTIANLMRLLELPDSIQEALQTGQISAGHARALLPLGDEQIQIDFCDQIISEGLSVRAIERAVAERIAAEDSFGHKVNSRKRRTLDSQIASLQQEMKQALGTKIQIKQGTRQKGQIVVHYSNHAEFERLRDILMGHKTNGEPRVA